MHALAPAALKLTPLEDQLIRESTAMASYALASGKHLPPAVAEILQTSQAASLLANEPASAAPIDTRALSWAHAQLTRLVAPAAPRAVLLLAEHPGGRGRWNIFGPIRLVRYLLALALLSMLGLLLVGATEQVSLTTENIFNLVGAASILNSLFLMFAASLGAAFSGLFRINLYIAATTYDPKYDASYWVQYGLGVIAGVLLATLIPLADATAGSAITRPVLALVGGFSASLLYRLMDRLSRTIESMVAGAPGYESTHPQDTGRPPSTVSEGGPPATADELMLALRQLITALSQTEALPSERRDVPEPRETSLEILNKKVQGGGV